MERYMVFTDLHFYPHGGDISRMQETIKVLDWVLERCLENDCKELFFLGDWGHVPKNTHNVVIDYTLDWLKKVKDNGINFHVLVGNHDAPETTNPLHGLPYMKPYAKTLLQEKGTHQTVSFGNLKFHMVSWHEQKELENIVSNIKTDKKCFDVLMLHAELKGATTNNGYKAPHGINPKSLSNNFDLTLSGHYHNFQVLFDNVLYIGTPLTTRHGEGGTSHGIMLLEYDTENNTLQKRMIYNEISPEHITLDSENLTEEKCKGNYVQILAKPEDNIKDIVQAVKKMGALKVMFRLIQATEEENSIAIDPNNFTPITVFKDYIEENGVPDNLDEERILEMGIRFIEKSDEQTDL